MTAGGCFCDKIRVDVTGAAKSHALCHCLDCRKISGSSYSNNYIVSEENFKVTSGSPKSISKTADSGKTITSFFCGDCGTTLYRTGGSFPGDVIFKAGALDDPEWPNQNVPKAELYDVHRIKWVNPVDGAAQLEGMP